MRNMTILFFCSFFRFFRNSIGKTIIGSARMLARRRDMVILLYSFILAALLSRPQICAQSAKEALTIWGLHVVPSLFPYMVFSKLLCEQIKRTNCPPALICAVLGAFGGSPSGAAMIGTYRFRLSDKAALSLAAWTGTISPMFFLGTVRSWTSRPSLCIQLLISQFAAALLTAVSVPFVSSDPHQVKYQDIPHHPDEKTPLVQSIDAVLQIGGCIICFSVIASLLGHLPLPRMLSPMLHALLEISGGIHNILLFPFPEKTQAILLAFVSGFGGLCILFQNLLFLRPVGIGLNKLLVLSFIRGLFSAAVMCALILL